MGWNIKGANDESSKVVERRFILLGLDNAGKTSIMYRLKNE